MSEANEIVKYQLDISDVEAKATRILQLNSEIAQARSKGEKTDELEGQLGKEVEGLGKLTSSEKNASGATLDLLKHKEKLAAAMNLVSSGSGELAGRLGSVVELLITAGPAAAGFAGALAGAAALIAVWRGVREEMERTIEKKKEWDSLNLSAQEKIAQRTMDIEKELGKYGQASPEKAKAAQVIRGQVAEQYGVELSAEAAARAAVEGLNVEEAGLLGMAMGEQGLDVKGRQGGRRFLTKLQSRPEAYQEALTNLQSRLRTEMGKLNQAKVEREGTAYGEVNRPGLSAMEREYIAARETGTLPPHIKSFGDWKADWEKGWGTTYTARLRENLSAEEAADSPLPVGASREQRVIDEYEREGAFESEGKGGGRRGGGGITVNNNTVNVGTVLNGVGVPGMQGHGRAGLGAGSVQRGRMP